MGPSAQPNPSASFSIFQSFGTIASIAGSQRAIFASATVSIFAGPAAHAATQKPAIATSATAPEKFRIEIPSWTASVVCDGHARGQRRGRRRPDVSFRDLERAPGAQVRGRGADPEVDAPRLDQPLAARAPERELFRRQRERDALAR